MLRLRSSIAHHRAEEFGSLLREMDGVRRVVQQADEAATGSSYVFVADVEPVAADRLVDAIAELGIDPDDYVLTRIEVVAPQYRHHFGEGGVAGYAWVEVVGQARANSRPLARYLALINVAAVIAALGVITNSSILIVGAMAVSPDLLPICATCVGLVARRYDLARRAFVTLSLGLGIVIATAAVLSALLNLADLLPPGFRVEQSSLSSLAHTDYSTVLIALAAGVAAMLSFETKASAAVGVAISVTTIPASAYLGVAIGGGGIENALGALVVLLVNVSLLILSGTLTLLAQRVLPNRSGT
ncbi:MAG TPA: DUF389 domain-containing protein, partial [Solirubrobacterales bacterium]|nr:DUF389 domain-containing protein [Solirubrobacterales bacterium]